MSGYLKFNRTGNKTIDAIQQAIETAGDVYHDTSYWLDVRQDGDSLISDIQVTMDRAAWNIKGLAQANTEAIEIIEGLLSFAGQPLIKDKLKWEDYKTQAEDWLKDMTND